MLEFLEKTWDNIKFFFEENVWNIITFFSAIVIGLIVISILMRMFKGSFKRHGFDPMAIRFICGIIRFSLFLLLILILLAICGVEINGIITALSAVVLAVGMALKECIANLASGIILVSSHKFKQGDYIVSTGVEGSIVDINFLFSTLKTPDGKQVTLPNSALVNNPVTNFGAYPKRRVSYDITVSYEADTELVKKVVLDSIASCGLTYLDDPAPGCKIKALDSNGIVFFVTFWVDSEDYWDGYFQVLDTIFNEFKRNNIKIPYQQIEYRERNDSPVLKPYGDKLPERHEKERKVETKKIELSDLEEKSLKEIKQELKEQKAQEKEKALKKAEKKNK